MYKTLSEREWLPSIKYSHVRTMEIECFKYGDNKRDEDFRFEIWILVTYNTVKGE